MIRVKAMALVKNFLVIIVFSSVKLVTTSPPSKTLSEQLQLMASANITSEGEHRHREQKHLFSKPGLVKHIFLKPVKPMSDFDSSPSTMDTDIRYKSIFSSNSVLSILNTVWTFGFWTEHCRKTTKPVPSLSIIMKPNTVILDILTVSKY
jgi:hypothetical protein